MKYFILLLISVSVFFGSCKSGNKISKSDAAGLDTITDINQLQAKQKAVFKNEKGEHFIMRYVPDPRDSVEENDTTRLISGGGDNSRYFVYFTANKRCDSDKFDGSNRSVAKTTISPASLQTYNTLRAFINTLPDKDVMAAAITGTSAPRIADEERNVRIKKAYLYAYSRQTDEDFHVIIGTTKNATASTKYFNVEISGLPQAGDASFTTLQSARTSFLTKATEKLCSSGYYFYKFPLKVEVSGSLFFDKQHHNGKIGPEEARPPNAWEIHPVTSIIYK